MNSHTELLKNGPITLLSQLAETYSADSGADLRAQVVVHTKSGKSWAGVPANFVDDRSRQYLILESAPKKAIVAIDCFEIQSVEFENLNLIDSLLNKPWLKDSRFSSITKLQLNRELDQFWNSIPHQKLSVLVDSFPSTDELPGALLSWLNILKSEINEVMSSNMGKEAPMPITQIILKFGTEPVVCRKENTGLVFEVSLAKESFEKTLIAKLLNDTL